MTFPTTFEIDFDDALNTYDALSGVVYKNKDFDPNNEESFEFYLCLHTMADCWIVDCHPVRILGDKYVPKYNHVEHIRTENLGEAVSYIAID